MGIDLSAIVRHGRKLDGFQEGCRFCDETMERLTRYFHCRNWLEYKEYVEPNTISCHVDDGITFNLHKDFWEIETCDNYFLYFQPTEKEVNVYRAGVFDYILALGETECWICDEYHGWGGATSDYPSTFEDWLENWSSQFDGEKVIPEFDAKKCIVRKMVDLSCIPKYHESFKECFDLLHRYERMFPEFKILTITTIWNTDCISGEKDGRLYLLNVKDGTVFLGEGFDSIYFYEWQRDRKEGFALYKGNLKAVFDREGNILTDWHQSDDVDEGSNCRVFNK